MKEISELEKRKKYKNLMDEVTDIENIRRAYKQASDGNNKENASYLIFKEYEAFNVYKLQRELIEGTYVIGEYYTFPMYEPKLRIISALPFRDRVVQHAINNVINPIFEKLFYSSSYACRPNKGTHKCVKKVQSDIRRLSNNGNVYALKMDFSKYFKSINSVILIKEIQRKIKDKKLLTLICQFIDEQGIKVGNLLSQLFANIYGHIFDRFIKTKIKSKYYYRYMDDTLILSNSKLELQNIQKQLQIFSRLYMKLKFSKWYIVDVEMQSINFIGYRIRKSYKLIRKDSVIRAKRKIKKYLCNNEKLKLRRFLASWKGHIAIADSINLKNYINKEIENAECAKLKILY